MVLTAHVQNSQVYVLKHLGSPVHVHFPFVYKITLSSLPHPKNTYPPPPISWLCFKLESICMCEGICYMYVQCCPLPHTVWSCVNYLVGSV